LKVPFDKEDRSGIVYVWVGNRADPEEARITEEIAREMYDGVRRNSSSKLPLSISPFQIATKEVASYY
jgi:hypothetical protein